MFENSFFRSTKVFKEFLVLDLIQKQSNITQRDIGLYANISVSMVNLYVDTLEKEGYMYRQYTSRRKIRYIITNSGIERLRILNIEYYSATQKLYNSAKENIRQFLIFLYESGFQKIILYGAGDVAKIFMNTINYSDNIHITCPAIVDDDFEKRGNSLFGVEIIGQEDIKKIPHDGILISSFANRQQIKDNLYRINYPSNKIIEFFEAR